MQNTEHAGRPLEFAAPAVVGAVEVRRCIAAVSFGCAAVEKGWGWDTAGFCIWDASAVALSKTDPCGVAQSWDYKGSSSLEFAGRPAADTAVDVVRELYLVASAAHTSFAAVCEIHWEKLFGPLVVCCWEHLVAV